MKGIRRFMVFMIGAALTFGLPGCGDTAAVPESTEESRSGSVAAADGAGEEKGLSRAVAVRSEFI